MLYSEYKRFFSLRGSDISRKQWTLSPNVERQKKWASKTYLLSKTNEHRASDTKWRVRFTAEQWRRQKDDTAPVLSRHKSILLSQARQWRLIRELAMRPITGKWSFVESGTRVRPPCYTVCKEFVMVKIVGNPYPKSEMEKLYSGRVMRCFQNSSGLFK